MTIRCPSCSNSVIDRDRYRRTSYLPLSCDEKEGGPVMTKGMLIRGAILGVTAIALSGCYYHEEPPPPPAYGYYNAPPTYGGYYYGPSASFGFYGTTHDDDDWHHGDGD